jgi:hypothetical protein
MTIVQPLGFYDLEQTEQALQASAINLGGFAVNQNYDPEIEDYRRMETTLLRLILQGNKKAAVSPTVRKLVKDKRANIGFVNRSDLSSATGNTMNDLRLNYDDPGQEVKAFAARLSFPHFARSMSEQQGKPYSDQVAEDTDDLLRESFRFFEMMLFNGNAAVNPLEFNGLQSQMVLPDHIFTIDITGTEPDRIWQTINEIAMRAATDRQTLRKISHVFTTGAAYVALQKESESYSTRFADKEIVPGLNVSMIMTGAGEKPVISSPYLNDLGNQAGYDILRMYLIDITCVEWHGVYPYGGTKTFDPQIFDITTYLNGQYLVTERMLLCYGTPYLKNNGLYRIDIRAPLGSAWNLS